ncbi:MAG: hypothetical protein KBT46_05535 [Ruminococcus sp.]|nr:hypothetical protein [Candidatus Copronaster equi]
MIEETKLVGSYNYIILDMDFSLDKEMLKVVRQSHAFVWVGDGSDISNAKLFRAYNALNAMEQNAESPLTNRLALIYNKFSNKTSKTLNEIGIKNVGGAPRYEHTTTAQVVGQLAPMDMFEKIL